MPKEICLTSAANYPNVLGLDSGVSTPEESLSRISIATSFGRAVVTQRVTEADADVWAAGLQHEANDHRYYEVTHESLGQQFEHYYLLLKDHAGSTRAIQPFLIVKQDLVTGLPKPVREAVAKLRQKFPSALVMRMLMVGCSAGEGHLVRDRSSGAVEWVAQSLRETLPRIAGGLKARMVVFKDFPRSYRTPLRHLLRSGYTRVPSMPGSRLELDFKDFEEYLTRKLSHKTRKNLRPEVSAGSCGNEADHGGRFGYCAAH